MKISIIAIGKRLADWVNIGFTEYAKRLPPSWQLQLIEIEAIKRGKNANLAHIIEQESMLLLNAVPPNNLTIALERNAKTINSLQISQQLQHWHDAAQDISLLIGGPEGLSQQCLQKVQQCWSISALTLPHPIVRIIIAEQIYRAWSIMARHPYHR